MMRGKFELDLLRDDAGNAVVVTGATVSVTIEGTGLPADLYDDITGPAGPGNPFVVVGSTIAFFADQDSRYRLDITTVGGYSRTLRYRSVTIDVPDIKLYSDTQIAAHSALVAEVHGILAGDAVESVSGAQAKADAVQTNLTSHINSATPHPNLTLDFEQITYPVAYQIGTPIHNDDLQELTNHAWSAGVTHGGDITDNGDGTITLDITYAVLRNIADEHATLYAISIAAQGPLALTDNSENYVYFDYNAGSPQWVASTSRASFNCLDKCIGYYIYRDGTNLNIIDARGQNVDGNRKSRQLFLKFQKFIHAEGGTALGGSGLALTVTQGEFFYMLQSLPHPAFDTSVAGTANENVFTLWYRDGIGGWTSVPDSKVINTTVYDNNTGTPVQLTSSRFGVTWIYVAHDTPSSLHAVMGQINVTSEAEAEAASPPATLPGILGAHGSLIGFVVYEKAAITFDAVLSAFTQIFTSSAASSHNQLAGLQGGIVDEYYHLTNTEHTAYGYHTRARSIAAPNAAIPVHSITAAGAETNIDLTLSPKGTGAITAQVADGAATGGNKRGLQSTDLQRSRTANTQVASGAQSFIGAGNGNTSSGDYSGIPCGARGTASGEYSVIGGGSDNETSGSYSVIPGGYYGTTRGLYGRYSYSSGRFTASGDAQIGNNVLRLSTTDATPSIITSNGLTASSTNVSVLPDNHAYAITARVIGRDTATGDVYHVVAEGTAKRGVGAATTALDGTPAYTTISKSAGASTWAVALVANTTRGSAEIQVTGEAATTIHWVCKFDTVEVG